MNTRLRRQAVGNIKKIKLLHFVLCGLFFSLCAPLHAQQLKKLPRIGYIAADSRAPTREAFRQGLRDFGYVEGKNILIEWRFADDKLNRFGEFAAELVRLNVDVIVSGNSNAVSVIHRATKRIPIVMATYGGDPVADGLVSSFARPEGNVTGVISLSPELSGKQLELLKETLPKLSRLAVIWNPDDSGARFQWECLQNAAESFGNHILSAQMRTAGWLDRAFELAMRERADAVAVPRAGFFYVLRIES
jgi:putative ABC transport system substrate-binding protein